MSSCVRQNWVEETKYIFVYLLKMLICRKLNRIHFPNLGIQLGDPTGSGSGIQLGDPTGSGSATMVFTLYLCNVSS